MRGISFFKRRVMSAYIRAEQVAPYIGARLNPVDGYEDDVCIFIKWSPAIKKYGALYLDVIDRHECIRYLRSNPDCKAIAISRCAEDYLKNKIKNDVVFIPQQHCNFDRETRDVYKPVKVVGYCGEYHTFAPYEKEIRERLAKVGLELKFYHTYKTRMDVVNFYKSIDIQIIWRDEGAMVKELKNPLKLSNAGSFGIPTVAYPEKNFLMEYQNCFVPVNNIQELVVFCKLLAETPYAYTAWSFYAQERAEQYHISNVSKYYLELLNNVKS